MPLKEDQIQQQIISYLSAMARKYNFIYYSPMNEAAMMIMRRLRVPQKTVSIMMSWMGKMGFLPGVSDIVILHNSKVYCMELKTATGKQSKGQIMFENNCKKTNVPYEVVRSLDCCIAQLRLWGIVFD